MRVHYTRRLLKSYFKAPGKIQKAFDKQIHLLESNLRHPSLHAKKYDEAQGVWQARITEDWRFYFSIEGDTYHVIDMSSHPK